jgi:hypothetical protein
MYNEISLVGIKVIIQLSPKRNTRSEPYTKLVAGIEDIIIEKMAFDFFPQQLFEYVIGILASFYKPMFLFPGPLSVYATLIRR